MRRLKAIIENSIYRESTGATADAVREDSSAGNLDYPGDDDGLDPEESVEENEENEADDEEDDEDAVALVQANAALGGAAGRSEAVAVQAAAALMP